MSRALFHEYVHVSQVFSPRTLTHGFGEDELEAFYLSSIKRNLPPMTANEIQQNAMAAIGLAMQQITQVNRPGADSDPTFMTKINYFLKALTPARRQTAVSNYKIPK